VHEWIAAGLPSKGEKTVALEMSIDAVMRTYESIRSDEFVPNGSTLRRPLSMDQREQLCILFGARASLPDFGPRIPPLDVSPPPARLPAEPSEAAPQPKPVLVDATLQAPVDEADADQTPASESSTAARPSTSTVSLSKSYTLTELIALPIHPTSALFPMLDGDAQRELVSDVRKNGCREPITIGTVNGILTLLDGRNRLAACSLAGVPPTVRVYDKDDSVAFIVSQNLRRRDLDPTRRALIAVELMPMIEVESKARMLAGEKDPGANLRQGSRAPKSSEIAANMVGVSARTVEMAKAVETKAIPDVRVAVADGTLSLATAARAANKPPEQQHEIVKECVAKKTAKAATRTKASTPTNEWQSTSKRSKRPKRASQITESPPDRLDQRQMLLLAPIDDLATELNNGRRYRAIGEINGELWEYLLEGSRLSVGPVNLRG
jgi:hypothetical protein